MKLADFIMAFSIAAGALLFAGPACGQQLEPRAYSPAPVGTNIAGVAFLYSSGSAVLDPSLPIENVNARVNLAVPFYARTLGLLGRQASLGLAVPLADATVDGDVMDVHRSVDRTGLGDPALRFAMNLFGGPALGPKEFFQHKPETTLGMSFTVNAPLGQYDRAKLINLGTNRWAFKPELGLSQPVGDWVFEVYAGVWMFTANDEFYGNQVRRQNMLASYQGHVVYSFPSRMWVALDFTYYTGGATTLNGLNKSDRQDNTRTGLTVAVPVSKSQAIKLSWSRGVSTRIGSDFDTFGLAWQWVWF